MKKEIMKLLKEFRGYLPVSQKDFLSLNGKMEELCIYLQEYGDEAKKAHEKLSAVIIDSQTIQKENCEKVEKCTRILNRNNKYTRKGKNIDIEKQMWELAAYQTAQYVINHMAKCPAFDSPEALREQAVLSSGEGLYLEFGVFSGKTINQIANLKPKETIYGFDSFQGLPETWRTGFEQNKFAVSNLPEVRENVFLIPGWFDETLPSFVEAHTEPCAFIHMDCDLYSSTCSVLHTLKAHIVPGTIILFDEYFNYPSWKQHEYKAFQEFIRSSNLSYEYIGYVKNYEQVAIKIV